MSSHETVTLMVGEREELFHAANITSDDQINQIVTRHKTREIVSISNLRFLLESARHAGFTHYNPKLKIWVALPPSTAPTTDVVFLDDQNMTPGYPFVGIAMNTNPRAIRSGRIDIHIDFLSLCVQSVFDPSIRKAAEHIADYRVLQFLAWFPHLSNSTYASILHGVHPVFTKSDATDEHNLIGIAALSCPGELLTKLVEDETKQFYSDIISGVPFQTPEEELAYQRSMKRYFHIANILIHYRANDIEWDKVCVILTNAAEKHGIFAGRTFALIAHRSKLAELTATFRKAVTDPFPEITASGMVQRLANAYGHGYATEILTGVLSNPKVHSSTLDFFAYGDVPELRAAVAGNPSVPIRMRAALTTTI